jgi:type II restriction enzyme
MQLDLPPANSIYKSAAQIARVMTEAWGARNLYCCACESEHLNSMPNNFRAADYVCPQCSQFYQLKSRRRWNENKVVDSAYASMMEAIRSDSAPNLLILNYTDDLKVENLVLVPHFVMTESAIEKRRPLGPKARRAGWVGCNILLNRIPVDGRIELVTNGNVADYRHTRSEFQRIRPVEKLPVAVRGWTLDVLRLVQAIGKETFTLSELYCFESELMLLHPNNRNIRPKIRQQLQVLRDIGFIHFSSPGQYSLVR